jgi:hypothetical protein
MISSKEDHGLRLDFGTKDKCVGFMKLSKQELE